MEVELKGTYEAMFKGIDDNVSQLKLKILNYDSELDHFVGEVKDDLISYKADLKEEFESRYATISVQVEKYKELEVELEKIMIFLTKLILSRTNWKIYGGL